MPFGGVAQVVGEVGERPCVAAEVAAGALGAAVAPLVEGEQASHDILESAAANGDDLIIVGHKGRKALERFLLGSVTVRVAHHAPCSVLSVRTSD